MNFENLSLFQKISGAEHESRHGNFYSTIKNIFLHFLFQLTTFKYVSVLVDQE